jgi:hypothetical protein
VVDVLETGPAFIHSGGLAFRAVVDALGTGVVCNALSTPNGLSRPVPISDEEFNKLLQETSSSRTGLLATLLAVTSFVFGLVLLVSVFLH